MTYQQGPNCCFWRIHRFHRGKRGRAGALHVCLRERVAFPFLIPGTGGGGVHIHVVATWGMNSKIPRAVWLCVGVIVAWGMRRMRRRKQAAGQAFGV